MLIRFKVSNSRSIDKELEFSAIATNDTSSQDTNTIHLPEYGVHLLKTMALFGANASGKSNVMKAISDAASLIQSWIPVEYFFSYCKTSESNISKPIVYSFDILIGKIHYNYSFSHDKKSVIEEKLVRWKNNEKEELIYSRIKDENNKYKWLPKVFFKNESADYFYKSTPQNHLFLTVANRPINSEVIQKIDILEDVYNWFREQLMLHINLDAPGKINYNYLITYILKSNKNKKTILELLKISDIHIADIQVIKMAEIVAGEKYYLYTEPNGTQSNVSIQTTHKNSDSGTTQQFDFFREESHGTQQFLAWIGSWLLQLQEGKQPKIFVIDELGTNLHPKLNQLLIKIFYSKKINPHNSQLIFTTHEVKLMDKSIMRPDQLYFVNKKDDMSSLIRASDFEDIDKYNRLDNLYMHGGLTGVPSIQDDINLDEILKDINL